MSLRNKNVGGRNVLGSACPSIFTYTATLECNCQVNGVAVIFLCTKCLLLSLPLGRSAFGPSRPAWKLFDDQIKSSHVPLVEVADNAETVWLRQQLNEPLNVQSLVFKSGNYFFHQIQRSAPFDGYSERLGEALNGAGTSEISGYRPWNIRIPETQAVWYVPSQPLNEFLESAQGQGVVEVWIFKQFLRLASQQVVFVTDFDNVSEHISIYQIDNLAKILE